MNNSTIVWTKDELTINLGQIERILNQTCFKRDAIFNNSTQSFLIKLIHLEEELLRQAQRAGKRIDFLDEVGTNGRIEDITSLLTGMSQSIYEFNEKVVGSTLNERILTPAINHFYGAGVGYFSNGLFFTCNHEDELAFFVGYNRVFFYRHLVRAFDEAKTYLQQVILN